MLKVPPLPGAIHPLAARIPLPIAYRLSQTAAPLIQRHFPAIYLALNQTGRAPAIQGVPR